MVNNGDTVRVHYTGKLKDGTVFDSSFDRDPLEFTMGEAAVISGFENAVRGMEVGQSKTVTMPPEEAYGPHFDEMVLVLNREQFPPEIDPTIGQHLQMQQENGREFIARITDVSEATITVDANHPLAGKELTFEIELVGVK
jgi:peptidylprolyl isomerase